jgi:hypothetical protein
METDVRPARPLQHFLAAVEIQLNEADACNGTTGRASYNTGGCAIAQIVERKGFVMSLIIETGLLVTLVGSAILLSVSIFTWRRTALLVPANRRASDFSPADPRGLTDHGQSG